MIMTEKEFIELMVGKPWVNRADSFDECDCYGLVKLYFKHVVGYELPVIEGYKEGFRFDNLWRKGINKGWRQVGRWQSGALVTFYDNKGNPAHVGICVGNQQVLHSPGTDDKPGKVSIHKLDALLDPRLELGLVSATFHGVVKNA